MSRTGLEGVHGGTGFTGFGAGACGFLGVEEVGEELGLGEGWLDGGVFGVLVFVFVLVFGVLIGHGVLSFGLGSLGA